MHVIQSNASVASVDEGMLQHIWNELDYRMDICRVAKG
jgi:hypothetical protein